MIKIIIDHRKKIVFLLFITTRVKKKKFEFDICRKCFITGRQMNDKLLQEII